MTATTQTAHTPGPWRVEPRTGQARAHYGDCICAAVYSTPTVSDPRDVICDVRDEANARLIAAAPELLEALRELVSRCDGPEGVTADGSSNIQTMRAHAVLEAL